MSDIFLSYSRKDKERVRPLVVHFERMGWSVFWDQNTPIGYTFRQYINENLDVARCVVVVWSQHSVKSHWVQEEAEEGRTRNILVPLKIEMVALPLGFRSIQTADLCAWNNDPSHEEFGKCVRAITALVPKRHQSVDVNVVASGNPVEPPTAKPQLPENFVLIKGGQFTMGSPEREADRSTDEKQHEVKVSDFAMCRYAVTGQEYLEFAEQTKGHYPEWLEKGNEYHIKTGSNDYYQKLGEALTGKNHPVVGVSWNDALAFCAWVTEKRGVGIFRLPTEAEWEYACRAGTATPFSTGENLTTDQANYNGNYPYGKNPKGEYREKTVPVDYFQPNGYGLYNMHGNVWEWCGDWYGSEYYEECRKQGVVENPQGPVTGSHRVLRGGSWNNYARNCRSACRNDGDPGNRHGNVGFRLVFVPQFKA